MRKASLAALLAILLLVSCALAEADPIPDMTDNYVQSGDSFTGMSAFICALNDLGYLDESDFDAGSATFTDAVCESVLAFQRAYMLTESGMLDPDTAHTLLLEAGCYPIDMDLEEKIIVYIPVRGGKKYHSDPTCSKMIDARELYLADAEYIGFEACKRCYK